MIDGINVLIDRAYNHRHVIRGVLRLMRLLVGIVHALQYQLKNAFRFTLTGDSLLALRAEHPADYNCTERADGCNRGGSSFARHRDLIPRIPSCYRTHKRPQDDSDPAGDIKASAT